MSTVRISGYSTFHVEKQIYKLFAKGLLDKFKAKDLLNKCSKIFNNASEDLEAVTNELNRIVIGDQ